jgi:hypothetical protein
VFIPYNAEFVGCKSEWHDTPSQQSSTVTNYGASPPIAPMHYGVDMAQGESQTVHHIPDTGIYVASGDANKCITGIVVVPDPDVCTHHSFGPYEPPYRVADMSEANSQCIHEWRMQMKRIAPIWEKIPDKPLPPGATRHKAISARCLALDSASDFMIGMRRA